MKLFLVWDSEGISETEDTVVQSLFEAIDSEGDSDDGKKGKKRKSKKDKDSSDSSSDDDESSDKSDESGETWLHWPGYYRQKCEPSDLFLSDVHTISVSMPSVTVH